MIAFPWVGRNEPPDLERLTGIANIEDPQPCVEVSQIGEVAGFLDIRIVKQLVQIVRAESAMFIAEVRVRQSKRRYGAREKRY